MVLRSRRQGREETSSSPSFRSSSSPLLPSPTSLLLVSKQWAKVGGYLQVISTQAKVVSQLSVKIVARQSLAFPQDRGAKEEDEILIREAVLKDVQLRKGANTSVLRLRLLAMLSSSR